MSSILLFREKVQKPGNQSLMEHQAILAVTRSILGSPGPKGMKMSGHKLIVPAHTDLLPLFALVADDYADFVEPESNGPVAVAPITLYWDKYDYESEDQLIADQFLHPRWFYLDEKRPDLNQVIRRYRPDTCIFFGNNANRFLKLIQFDNLFRQIIGFSMFMPEQAENIFQNVGAEVVMADRMFDQEIARAMRSMDMPYERPEQAGFWYRTYRNDEKSPELEPFVAFGAAFEMAMFRPLNLR